jgi:hypothetical protein
MSRRVLPLSPALVALVSFAAFTPHAQADGAAPGDIPQPITVTVTPTVKPPASKRSVVPAVALGALAAAGIGSGIAFGLVSFNQDLVLPGSIISAQRGSCIPNVDSYDARWCPQLLREVHVWVTYGNVAAGSFIVGGAAAAATALYLLWPSSSATTPGPSVARDLRLTPIVGPTGNGLVVSGRF